MGEEPPGLGPGSGAHVDRSLRLRVRIYLLILVVSTVIVGVDLARIGEAALLPVATCGAVAVVLGLVASRMSKLGWDAVDRRVVGRMDAVGAFVLVGYVVLVLVRGRVLAEWLEPGVVGVAGVAFLTGLMLGQVVGTVGGVVRVLSVAGRSGPA